MKDFYHCPQRQDISVKKIAIDFCSVLARKKDKQINKHTFSFILLVRIIRIRIRMSIVLVD